MNRYIAELVYHEPLRKILEKYPIGYDFLENLRLAHINKEKTLEDALSGINGSVLEDFEINTPDIVLQFVSFLSKFSSEDSGMRPVTSLTIMGGHNKSGAKEDYEITLKIGEVISVVGPTGSGKSRLLEDIECLAQGDTPTGRFVFLDGMPVDDESRFDMGGKLVAQLSQNMNYVMDLTVKEFLELHARSRLKKFEKETIETCFMNANGLAGEKFDLSTKVTQLSGGQSRALMIADTAFMSESPIILIDEIENAGINRKEAIKLLAGKEKIIFISTHDPLLALNADKRIVIHNGGISQVMITDQKEKSSLKEIERLDSLLHNIREDLRLGRKIHTDFSIKGLS